MMCGERHADESAHRMADHVERIGAKEIADLQQIANMAVPTVGTGRGDLAVATATQVHGDDVMTRRSEGGH